MSAMKSFSILVYFSLMFSVNGRECIDPKIISTSYYTRDATILKHVAYISNFHVKCRIGESGNLYALFGGEISPVASVGPGNYQISWTTDVKTALTNDVIINVYNESGYTAMRKAKRAGEDISFAPVFTRVTVNNRGLYVGPWISCELLAAVFSIVIAYIAIHFRTKLLS
ncbi:translocon-associated protein subunit delta [Leptinotarsa decemlineata]|uniref:translocon-associated protein subunit delta n=1 Tax=Leptinotarsa decemlineata TaxID=7539 RepID=UPI003D3057E0